MIPELQIKNFEQVVLGRLIRLIVYCVLLSKLDSQFQFQSDEMKQEIQRNSHQPDFKVRCNSGESFKKTEQPANPNGKCQS